MDSTGAVHVIELKRDKTPRDVAAQVLDYGSWVAALSHEDVLELFTKRNSIDRVRPGVRRPLRRGASRGSQRRAGLHDRRDSARSGDRANRPVPQRDVRRRRSTRRSSVTSTTPRPRTSPGRWLVEHDVQAASAGNEADVVARAVERTRLGRHASATASNTRSWRGCPEYVRVCLVPSGRDGGTPRRCATCLWSARVFVNIPGRATSEWARS